MDLGAGTNPREDKLVLRISAAHACERAWSGRSTRRLAGPRRFPDTSTSVQIEPRRSARRVARQPRAAPRARTRLAHQRAPAGDATLAPRLALPAHEPVRGLLDLPGKPAKATVEVVPLKRAHSAERRSRVPLHVLRPATKLWLRQGAAPRFLEPDELTRARAHR